MPTCYCLLKVHTDEDSCALLCDQTLNESNAVLQGKDNSVTPPSIMCPYWGTTEGLRRNEGSCRDKANKKGMQELL